MLNERCKKCESAVWEQSKDGTGHVVDCEYAGVDVFIRVLFFDDIMHTVVVCPYFTQRGTDDDIQYREWNTDEEIPYTKHGEAAMSIIDIVLDAVYEVKPEIVSDSENSLIYGDLYYHIEEVIGGIIQKCIDEDVESVCNLTEEVKVHTDGNTLWVNSGSRCEIRIVGLGDLKYMRSIKAVMYKSDNIKDVMILGD